MFISYVKNLRFISTGRVLRNGVFKAYLVSLMSQDECGIEIITVLPSPSIDFFSVEVSRAVFVSSVHSMFIFFIANLDREISRLRCFRICFEIWSDKHYT